MVHTVELLDWATGGPKPRAVPGQIGLLRGAACVTERCAAETMLRRGADVEKPPPMIANNFCTSVEGEFDT